MAIYPVNSTIQPLNNRGLADYFIIISAVTKQKIYIYIFKAREKEITMAYFTSYFAILMEGSFYRERLRQILKFCYFPFGFFNLCKTFLLIVRPFCILSWKKNEGKISAQPHTIVKQICLPNGNVLFLSLFSLSKN